MALIHRHENVAALQERIRPQAGWKWRGRRHDYTGERSPRRGRGGEDVTHLPTKPDFASHSDTQGSTIHDTVNESAPPEIPGYDLLPKAERLAAARCLLWARVAAAVAGAAASILLVIVSAGKLL
jgi:hypothetical protein